jgi:hypothetical protein
MFFKKKPRPKRFEELQILSMCDYRLEEGCQPSVFSNGDDLVDAVVAPVPSAICIPAPNEP